MNEDRSFAALRPPRTSRWRLLCLPAGALVGYGYGKLVTAAPATWHEPIAQFTLGTIAALLGIMTVAMWRDFMVTRHMNRLLEDNEQLLRRLTAASPTADRPARDCPFYGFSGMVASPPGMLMATGGNQCGAILERHTPCVMEMGGQAVEWWHCPLLDDRRFTALPHDRRKET